MARNDKEMGAGALGLTEKTGFHGDSLKSLGLDHADEKRGRPMGSPPGHRGGGKGKIK